MLSWIKPLKPYRKFLVEIKRITGLKPKNENFYSLIFGHDSVPRKTKLEKIDNERLEFLGDGVLGLVVADFLYDKYRDKNEGFLTSMRSKIVSRKNLNILGAKMGLHKLLVKASSPQNIRSKHIYGNALEGLIGAIYLDHNYQNCKKFIEQKILSPFVNWGNIEKHIASHKGIILEWAQKNKQNLRLEVTNSWGESHNRKYEVSISLNDKLISKGVGTSKRRAEEEASMRAYKIICSSSKNEKA